MSSLYQKHFPNRHLKIEYLVLVLVVGDHSIAQHMLQGPNRNFLNGFKIDTAGHVTWV